MSNNQNVLGSGTGRITGGFLIHGFWPGPAATMIGGLPGAAVHGVAVG